jgi:GH25 family lysozyme M1 (1,4-beta-N-acetylmuramidase)
MIRTYKHGDTTQITPHFKASEFQCKCGKGHDFQLDDELVEHLEQFFVVVPELFGVKVKCINVSSGFRCVSHDKSVGGSGTGQHTLGRAADYTIILEDGSTFASWKVCIAAQEIGFRGIARINDRYTHSDTRNGKWYGDETKGNSYCIPCKDFYTYYNIEKEDEELKNGIDVSAHQGKIDWSKVKTDFAILRAGFGKVISQKDEQFEANYSGAKAAGIPVGAYWYSYAMTPDEAREEADVFLKVLAGKQFEYPVYFDIEEQKQLALGKEKASEIIKAFLEKVEGAGYWVGLYMSASPLTTHVESDIKSRYTIWVANVGVQKPSYSGTYGLWQYSWTGKVSGITGDVDMDYSYQDYPAKIKAKGLNGFGAVVPDTPTKKTITAELTVDGVRYKGTLTEI